MADEKVVLDRDDMRRTLVRTAHEIVEGNAEGHELAIVGIHRRGAVLAGRVHALGEEMLGEEKPRGALDISFYRDHVAPREGPPVVHASPIDFDVTGPSV